MKNNLLKKLLILPVFLLTVGMMYGQTVVKGVVSDSSERCLEYLLWKKDQQMVHRLILMEATVLH